jgi:hypothetical protein
MQPTKWAQKRKNPSHFRLGPFACGVMVAARPGFVVKPVQVRRLRMRLKVVAGSMIAGCYPYATCSYGRRTEGGRGIGAGRISDVDDS